MESFPAAVSGRGGNGATSKAQEIMYDAWDQQSTTLLNGDGTTNGCRTFTSTELKMQSSMEKGSEALNTAGSLTERRGAQ